MRTPRLVADDLVLEAPDVGDADDWSDAQDDECARWFGWPCRPGVERCRAHLERVANNAEPGSFTWAIRVPAGFAGGADLKLHDNRWNVSYFVHPAPRDPRAPARVRVGVRRPRPRRGLDTSPRRQRREPAGAGQGRVPPGRGGNRRRRPRGGAPRAGREHPPGVMTLEP